MTTQRSLLVRRFTALQFVSIALAAAGMVLGWFGFRTYLEGHPEFGHGFFDLLYYSCQLFVLDADPLNGAGSLPWALEVARFLAPLATLSALVEAVRLLGADELRRLRLARLEGHSVVCGAGNTAQMLTARLREAGRTVVAVSAVGADDDGVLSVVGDPSSLEALRAAGVARASAVYACADDSGDNVLIAATVRELVQDPARSLHVHAAIGDQNLCSALQARHLMGASRGRVRLDFFNVDMLAARRLAATERIEEHDAATPPPHCLIVGVSPFARALLVELARRWRLRPGTGLLPITWAGASATAALSRLSDQYEFLPEVCRIEPKDIEETGSAVNALLSATGSQGLRVYIAGPSDDTSLSIALSAFEAWRVPPGGLVLQLREHGPFGVSLGHDDSALLDDLDGRLSTFGVLDAACRPDLLGDDLVEHLARVLHEHYEWAARTRRGESEETNASVVPWDRLPARKQEDNRQAVLAIGEKLRALDCAIAPRLDPAPPFVLEETEVERLARMEHRRWLRARRAEGVVYGPDRDDDARTHPDMKDWDELTEPAREKDREAVRALPVVLATAGFQIIRLAPGGP
ncbi:RyR domain-containing protein [Streptomyces sp. NBC_00663]|uniref:RyR domain-containing protein n=1 Tax=Streptomyces sp. NBC_00663 TaxID=2975801 RepID=UPI002E368E89|nr:RyR domain-containing protein [Streptomyces sp. NBC_00663]